MSKHDETSSSVQQRRSEITGMIYRDVCNTCHVALGGQHKPECPWNGEVGRWSGVTGTEPGAEPQR